MTVNQAFESKDIILFEAATWVAQLESGPISVEDEKALKEWVIRSPAHRAALRQCARAWVESDVAAILQPFFTEALHEHRLMLRRSRYRPARRRLAATLVGLAIVFTAIAFVHFLAVREVSTAKIATGYGETVTAALPDGSAITVNSSSRVEVDIDPGKREVRLASGEAIFDVAKDSDRPFTVVAGEHVVQAIGTVFSVRYDSGEVNVSVLEGSVRLLQGAQVPSTPSGHGRREESAAALQYEAYIVAGQEFTAAPEKGTFIEAVELSVLKRRSAWRDNLLDFNGERLDFVLSVLSQHTGLTFKLESENLAQTQVAGIFQLSNADQAVDIIAESLGLEATEISQGVILITQKEIEIEKL